MAHTVDVARGIRVVEKRIADVKKRATGGMSS